VRVLGAGVGLMVLGAILVRWGVSALRKKPTASSDYRLFLGAAVFALGAATVVVGAVISLLD
jgi:hypothetical protein